MADIFEPTITSFSNREQDLEQRVTVLEGLVKQLDDLILKNAGFNPEAAPVIFVSGLAEFTAEHNKE